MNARYDNGWYYCWLIERRDMQQPMWWQSGQNWTSDANKATWFARKSDAERVPLEAIHDTEFRVVCEHGFQIDKQPDAALSRQEQPPTRKLTPGETTATENAFMASVKMVEPPQDVREIVDGLYTLFDAAPTKKNQLLADTITALSTLSRQSGQTVALTPQLREAMRAGVDAMAFVCDGKTSREYRRKTKAWWLAHASALKAAVNASPTKSEVARDE